ncbi:MAG: SelD-related putative sulfur metabolism protein [Candidatus Bipolaricaulota bacterium]|nr:SelD-related putative sulfur metabolism protein [Candidatus Bipolaricaulota bacterium]
MAPWDEIERNFRELGLDPYRLACGCSVKADLGSVVYPALEQIRPQLAQWGIALAPRQEADIAPWAGSPTLHRLWVRLESESQGARNRAGVGAGSEPARAFRGSSVPSAIHTALTLTSVYRPTAQSLAQYWLSVYQELADAGLQFTVGKGHTIVADSPEHQFVLFDFVEAGSTSWHAFTGSTKMNVKRSLLISNHDTIQLIDLTLDPADFRQTAAALANALNDLFALGAVEDIQIFPAIAAPTDGLLQQIHQNIQEFCALYGYTLVPQAPLPVQTLLLGATVTARSDHRPPVFSDEIRPGDQMLVHRALGELAPINLYVESLVLGADGRDRLFRAKEQALEIMARPNRAVGRLVSQYSPVLGEPFDPQRHIKISGDLSGAGLGVVRELGVSVKLERIPFLFEDLVERARRNGVLRDGTMGTNGAIFVIATPRVIERFGSDLASLGYEPHVIGRVI